MMTNNNNTKSVTNNNNNFTTNKAINYNSRGQIEYHLKE